MAIITLCSQLLKNDATPIEPKEWSIISKKLMEKQLEPKDLYNFSKQELMEKLELNEEICDRIVSLLKRSGSIAFELENYNKIGIKITTRASINYPKKLKSELGQSCPPLFYYAGDLDLMNCKTIGFVGSRDVDSEDIIATRKLVKSAVKKGYGVVSGGAKGVDSIATEEAINSGGIAVEFLSDGLMKKLKNSSTVDLIRKGKLLLLSAGNPDVGFNVGLAMQRNRFIHAQAVATTVIKSSFNKGGTWSGATDNIKHYWSPLYCLNNGQKGNTELIKLGATPIDIKFDFSDIKKISKPTIEIQQSIFNTTKNNY